MLVYLHGGGLAGKGLESLKESIEQRIIPHVGDLPMILLTPSLPGSGTWQPDELIAAIDKVSAEISVDQDRVYLIGYSRGGNGSWKLGAAHSDRFAVVAPIAGRGIHSVCRIKPAKVRIFHGSADPVVPVESSQSMTNNLEGCDADVELTVYPDVGHNAQGPTFKNPKFWAWLLAQSRN